MRASRFAPAALAVVVAASTGFAPSAHPTAFALRGAESQVVAAADDLPGDSALVVLNRRGLVKRAMVADGVEPVSWVAGYGSVTVTSYGPDFPLAGINQAGLVVVAVPLEGAAYAPRGRNAEIDPLQWVQYALDSFENVRQVVYSAEQYRIHGPVGYHFLTCDARGACAVIEPIDGAVVSRAEDRLPLAILTTRTFDDAIDYLNVSLGYAGRVERTGDDPVLERFVASVDKVNAARSRKTTTPREDAFRILSQIEGEGTDLRMVFDPAARAMWLEAGGEPWPVPVFEFDLTCAPEPPAMIVVPPIPEDGAAKAFGELSGAKIKAVASASAAAVDAISSDAAAAMSTWAQRYRCSDLPPIKHPSDPASIPVD